MSANFNPVMPCEENEVVKIALTTLKETNLKDDFIPIIKLDKSYAKKGFKYSDSQQHCSLSPYIEERNYILENVTFDGDDEIVLRFEIKQGNSAAKDNRGYIHAIGRGVNIVSQTEFTIKYDQKILLRISKEDVKSGAYIDFYANDNDLMYYSVSNVHCGRVRISSTGKCVCEERVRAYMTMLRVGEGTLDDGGYGRIVGGSSFEYHGKDFSDHPKIYITKYNSTAAGAYQITKTNWDDIAFSEWRKTNGVTDFSKISQDKYCYYLLKIKRKALDDIKSGKIKEAIKKCSKEWASLPGAGYNQREEKLLTVLSKFEEFYKDELTGKTKLHIKRGFLKDFKEACTCGCEENDTTISTTKLSKYLTYEQAIYSDVARKNNIDNSATEEHVENLKFLGTEIYDVLFEHFDGKIKINSCYRSKALNSAISGSLTSQHCKGQAIDIAASSPHFNREIFEYIINNIEYDQIIWEYGNNTNPKWVHISRKKSGNRKAMGRISSFGVYSTLDLKTVNIAKK